ncbi:MAG: dockerin type I repeat-containing protein [Methanomassiliicoccaceae archaeon]|nr:dockerin type I repeat-containing protein [Methanomassiliicoccaceae archaeon]
MISTSKMIAIAVVAVVVVAGAGVALFALGGGKEKIIIDAELEVYGNANGDGRIDQADIDLVREIIAGARSFEDHPLADANYDGVVDEKDVQQIERIINATSTNKVRIYHINHYGDEVSVVDTLYPITSAAATSDLVGLLIFKYLGIVDELKGFAFSATVDDVLFSEFMPNMTEDRRIGLNVYTVDVDMASNLVDRYGITAIVTQSHTSYLSSEVGLLEGAGIDVVRIQSGAVDSKEYMSTILFTAFMFDTDGKGYMDKCEGLINWYEDFLTDLDGRLGGVPKRVTAVASSMTTYVSTGRSEYAYVLQAAGADYVLSDLGIPGTSVSYVGASDTWLNAYDFDYLVCMRGSSAAIGSWYGDTVSTAVLASQLDNFSTLECYEKNNVYVICGELPVMLRIAYTAQALYGDVFGPDYAYNLHVDFVKRFFGWDESMIKDKPFLFSMEDLGLTG